MKAGAVGFELRLHEDDASKDDLDGGSGLTGSETAEQSISSDLTDPSDNPLRTGFNRSMHQP